MELPDVQEQVDAWIHEHGGYWDEFQILARPTEEPGEVAAAMQRSEGLRPREEETDLAGEVGDRLFTLAAFANVNGLDVESCLRQVFEKHS